MTDKELADKVVALGVGVYVDPSFLNNDDECYRLPDFLCTTAEKFVRDWRVAGALMEKAYHHEQHYEKHSGWSVRVVSHFGADASHKWAENKSLPRAIIEACVEALSD